MAKTSRDKSENVQGLLRSGEPSGPTLPRRKEVCTSHNASCHQAESPGASMLRRNRRHCFMVLPAVEPQAALNRRSQKRFWDDPTALPSGWAFDCNSSRGSGQSPRMNPCPSARPGVASASGSWGGRSVSEARPACARKGRSLLAYQEKKSVWTGAQWRPFAGPETGSNRLVWGSRRSVLQLRAQRQPLSSFTSPQNVHPLLGGLRSRSKVGYW